MVSDQPSAFSDLAVTTHTKPPLATGADEATPGVRAWSRAQIPDDAEASPVMPEICVEVLSRSNTRAEMEEKRDLFFEDGAEKVWIVDADGHVTFCDAEGETEQSQFASDFPQTVEA